jgi:hypothetical protein
MSIKHLLILPDDVRDAVRDIQIDLLHETRERVTLNEVLVELIRTSKPVSKATEAILRRAALKTAEAKSVEAA